MRDISALLELFQSKLTDCFGDRICFVGLQGSYARGEATKTSDIDLVVILDELNSGDVYIYNGMLDTLPDREYICGFLAGKNELFHWDTADLFQFYHDTMPLIGSLDVLLPYIDEVAVRRAIKMSVCNIYHGCLHNMLHEKSDDILKGLYKTASFTLQAIAFLQTGTYISRQIDLLNVLHDDDHIIAETNLRLKSGDEIAFDWMSETLFNWAKKWITT